MITNVVNTVLKEYKDLESFIGFVKRKRGINLGVYRASFVQRRLNLRMSIRGAGNIIEYKKMLRQCPGEWDVFFDGFSINVSRFFRDPEVFNYFHKFCLKEIVENKNSAGKRIIKVWSAGCSAGEETYSVAILLKEALRNKNQIYARVWGTDINEIVLKRAKDGKFRENSLQNVNPSLLKKYFVSLGSGVWQAKNEIKDMIVFRRHDLAWNPPIRFVDAIFCRNVRIYFNGADSEKVLKGFYNVLNKDGYLVLGKVEAMPASLKKFFVQIEGRYKIFQKRDTNIKNF